VNQQQVLAVAAVDLPGRSPDRLTEGPARPVQTVAGLVDLGGQQDEPQDGVVLWIG
jgi:hypothetical protein